MRLLFKEYVLSIVSLIAQSLNNCPFSIHRKFGRVAFQDFINEA